MQTKGYTNQKVVYNILKEIMSDAEKLNSFVELQRSIANFISIMGDVDI